MEERGCVTIRPWAGRVCYEIPQKRLWSSILKFLYAWSLLAIVVWGPIYSYAAGGGVVPAYGLPMYDITYSPTAGKTPYPLKVGDTYTFTAESQNRMVYLTFLVAEEAGDGFLIHATYRVVRFSSQAGEIEIVYPTPEVQEEEFLVDSLGYPLAETYTSWYWASIWSQ